MSNTTKYLMIALGASLLFFPFLGNVHLFDWDEINFAECAREMIVTKNYLQVQIDYQPFWEKPPLFIWLQVLSMKVFGINEYAARFPNALVGVVTLLSIFYVGKRIVSEKMALLWVGLYVASWLPHFYFKSGIIDPTFNLFIFLAFFQAYLVRESNRKILHSALSGAFLGLAVLTKGPAAILIALLAFGVYIILNRGLKGYNIKHIVTITLSAFATTCIWFGLEIINNGWWMVNEFITYQIRLFSTEDAGHGGPFYYHFIILLIGCFPASIFMLNKGSRGAEQSQKAFKQWMSIMFWVVLILFSVVKTKIVHYSSLCYFPLTFLAAYNLYALYTGKSKLNKLQKVLFVVIGPVIGLAIALLPVVGINKDKLIPYINDPFAVANLQADISWSYGEMLWGVLYIIMLIVSVTILTKNVKKGFLYMCIAQVIIIQVTVAHFTPKVEGFSQRAAIEFFESLEGKDVYVQVLGYKSYAHLFYQKKMPLANKMYYDRDVLLNGEVDKPTYFVCKNTKAEEYLQSPLLELVEEKNGFLLFKRK